MAFYFSFNSRSLRYSPRMNDVIKDAKTSHWVYRAPAAWRPYLQLSRLDRPVGYWLLTLPGWIGLAFASLSHGFAVTDLKWAILILIGAIAMRGAGCTYNDIVDQDLDAQVDRTALRPLPAGTITTKQAWIWVFAQCAIGLIVLLCLPRLAQIISLAALPLVAAYPFMKRITWWPQVWLGMTFNWAVLVAYAAKTGEISPAVLILYAGMIFWTIGYDTIYACQDIEDDAMIGVKSTARRFGEWLLFIVCLIYVVTIILVNLAISLTVSTTNLDLGSIINRVILVALTLPFGVHLIEQVKRLRRAEQASPDYNKVALKIFKSNMWAMFILITSMLCLSGIIASFTPT